MQKFELLNLINFLFVSLLNLMLTFEINHFDLKVAYI